MRRDIVFVCIMVYVYIMAACSSDYGDFQVKDGMMRSDLVKCSLAEQRSVFSTLSPEMKSRLYQFKIREDLRKQSLSKTERKILKELHRCCTPEFYNKTADSLFEARFIGRLAAEGWDDVRIFKYTMTYMTVSEFDAQYAD